MAACSNNVAGFLIVQDILTMVAKMEADTPKPEEKPGSKSDVELPRGPPLEDLAGKTPAAKCGYEVKVVFQPGFSIGKVREALLIHTNIPFGMSADAPIGPPMQVSFTGTRSGPVQILSSTVGTLWSPEESVFRLGRFSAKEGRKAKLILFIKKSDQELEITEAKLDPPQLKYEFRKDENFNAPGRSKYELVVEVPAGGVPLSLGGGERAGSVVLQTNHPDAKTIKFDLEFTSF